jgi:hypothetical protein
MSLEDRLISRLVGDPNAIARVQGMGLCAEVFETPLNRLAYDFVIEYWLDSDKTAAPTALVIEAEYPPFKVLTDVDEEAWWLTERLQKRAVTNAFQEIVRGIGDCHTDPIGAVHRLAEDSAKAEKLAGTGAGRRHRRGVEAGSAGPQHIAHSGDRQGPDRSARHSRVGHRRHRLQHCGWPNDDRGLGISS